MDLRIHAICLALNEETFIDAQLETLYPYCSGISILTQYDRDWFGNAVEPDRTVPKVLDHPDPDGKIHLVVRRWRDQAAALNSELKAMASEPHRGIESHGTPMEEIRDFHGTPDYFLIVDADEIYDVDTFPDIVDYLDEHRPRGMRVTGYQYLWGWNERIPIDEFHFNQFGFLKPGITFEYVRRVTWNETRLSKLFSLLHLPDFSSQLFGFIDCPPDVGVFHHGAYLGGEERLEEKFSKHAHQSDDVNQNLRSKAYSRDFDYDYIPTRDLPRTIREHDWPSGFLDAGGDQTEPGETTDEAQISQ